MEKNTYKNLLITRRDAEILSLVTKLKIAESDLVRDLISPETSQNTFTKRLKKMERKGYLKALGGSFRSRCRNKLYGINPIKRKEVEEISGTEVLGGNVDMSHSNYYHTLYIGYFLRFIVKNVRKKRSDFKLEVSDFHSQYEIRKIVSSLSDNEKGAYAIPDGLLKLGNAAVFVEIERRNSSAEFSKKMRKYKERWFHLSKGRLPSLTGNAVKYKLFVTAAEWKIGRYREILEKEKIKDYYDVRILCEDLITKA